MQFGLKSISCYAVGGWGIELLFFLQFILCFAILTMPINDCVIFGILNNIME